MGSVNWQRSDYYKSLKDYEKETGLSLAERNAQMNPYGNHSAWGVFISQLLPELLLGGAEKLCGSGLSGSGDTGSTTDIDDITTQISKLGKIKAKYQSNNSPSAIDDYLKELNELKKEYPDNRKIKVAIIEAEKTKKNGGRRTSQI